MQPDPLLQHRSSTPTGWQWLRRTSLLPAALWHTLRQQLPHRCLLCHLQTQQYQNRLCDRCWGDLPFGKFRCLGCGNELQTSRPWCGQCQQQPPTAPLITAAGYTSPLKELITLLKYRRQAICAKPLAQLLVRRIRQQQQVLPLPDAIVPVPLHPQRLRHRGFNQAALLGQEVAKILDLPLVEYCQRQRNTPPQAQLNAKQRQQNLDRAFSVTVPIRHHCLALIDDVVTTGSTLDALATVLREAGVDQLQYWCIAKTQLTHRSDCP